MCRSGLDKCATLNGMLFYMLRDYFAQFGATRVGNSAL